MIENQTISPLWSRLKAIQNILMAHHAAGASFPSAAKENNQGQTTDS
jgi:hypothetical protein